MKNRAWAITLGDGRIEIIHTNQSPRRHDYVKVELLPEGVTHPLSMYDKEDEEYLAAQGIENLPTKIYDRNAYDREKRMKEGKCLIVVRAKHEKFGLKIIEVTTGKKPSNYIGMAPAGINLGDEKLLMINANKRSFTVDTDKLIKKKSKERTAQEQREVDEWNDKGFFGRIKDAL